MLGQNSGNREGLKNQAHLVRWTEIYDRERLQLDIERSEEDESNLLWLIELKDFKQVKDTLGRISGDRLLA